MHADFSVELGRDDAALELPWSSADPAVRFYDLKRHPELLQQVPEAAACPELGAFLARINAAGFPLATAKCDMWRSREVAPEEEIYGDRKFVSYIDLVFEGEAARCSFEKHETFAKNLCRLLGQAPGIPASVEMVIRRCYYHGERAFLEVADEAVPDGDEVEKEFDADDAGVAGDPGVGDAADVGDEAETRDMVEAEAVDAGDKSGAGGAVEVNNAADAKDIDERLGGVANRENSDRVDPCQRPPQQVDVRHGTKYVGHACAGERTDPDIEKTECLDETVTGERARTNGPDGSVSGFCFTAYVTGFGDSDHEPRLRWQIALALLQNALVQLARD